MSKIISNKIVEMLATMQPDDPPKSVDVGNPQFAYTELVSDEQQESGVWSMSVGGFTVESYSVSEVMVMLEGHMRLTDTDGNATDLTTGDMFYIPKEWSGRWDVLEDMQKAYVIIY